MIFVASPFLCLSAFKATANRNNMKSYKMNENERQQFKENSSADETEAAVRWRNKKLYYLSEETVRIEMWLSFNQHFFI